MGSILVLILMWHISGPHTFIMEPQEAFPFPLESPIVLCSITAPWPALQIHIAVFPALVASSNEFPLKNTNWPIKIKVEWKFSIHQKFLYEGLFFFFWLIFLEIRECLYYSDIILGVAKKK
jgi:hypothetical protein